MLLPRGKKEMGQPEVGPGFYPPVMNQLSLPEDPERWGVDPSYSMTHSAETMAKVKGIGRGKKYNLMAQVIPIYGFGILLYILYIIYKLTCKGKTTKSGNYATITKANMESKIVTDDEYARLQERLLQTERMMERIVSEKKRVSGSGRRRKSKTTTSKKEEKLLRQLRQITQLMQEGRLEGASPEMEAEEVPYGADWEGYPDETYPEFDEPYDKYGFDTFTLEDPVNQPTAEALAERMEQEEEEIMARNREKTFALSFSITAFSRKMAGESWFGDDPVMEAENLLFSCEGGSNPEEEAEEEKEEYLLMAPPVEGEGHIHADVPKEVGVSGLRMRNRRET
eukprot:superscaffoldBa00000061_g1001